MFKCLEMQSCTTKASEISKITKNQRTLPTIILKYGNFITHTLLIFFREDAISFFSWSSWDHPQICTSHFPLEHDKVSSVRSNFDHYLIVERHWSILQFFFHFP